MNEIMKPSTGTGLVSREALLGTLQKASMAIPVKGGDFQFLKVDQEDGAWLYGQENTEIDPDGIWAVDVRTFQHGYIAWHNSMVEEEVLIPIAREMPARETLKPVKAIRGWEEQRGVNMVCISGDDKGVQALYKASSVGAMKFFANLTNAVLAQAEGGSDALFPLIRLSSSDYISKKHGNKIVWNPLFEVVEWRELMDDRPAGAAANGNTAPGASDEGEDPEQEAELARQYEAEQAKQTQRTSRAPAQPEPAATNAEIPRRRLRR